MVGCGGRRQKGAAMRMVPRACCVFIDTLYAAARDPSAGNRARLPVFRVNYAG